MVLLTPRWIQKTTFAKIDGEGAEHSEKFVQALEKANIPYDAVSDMHAWQLCHLAMVVPLADAYYDADDPKRAWADRSLMRETARRIKTNFVWLSEMGVQLTPARMSLFRRLPVWAIGTGLRVTYRSRFGERFMYQHSVKAPDEMRRLHNQFYEYIVQNREAL